MKNLLKYLFIFVAVTPFYGQIESYYNGLDLNLTGNELFLELSGKLESTHSGISYTSSSTDVWDACKLADEDPEISTNVILIYGFDNTDGDHTTDRTRDNSLQDTGGGTGVWNREHVFPKSLAIPTLDTGSPGPGTDVHNLRPADAQRNSTRSNRKFTEGSGVASYITSNGGWYPGDEWKGDVARMAMYMYSRYHGDGSLTSETKCLPINVGIGEGLASDSNMIDLFLKWNVEDPVSDFEANRNEVLAGIQLNRNPFIDNPYLATIIWGGLAAEDKWWSNNSSDTEAPTAPANLNSSNITDESFDISWNASTDNVEVYDYLVYLNGDYLQPATSTSTTISNLSSGTSYAVTVKARDMASNLSVSSSILSVSTLDGPKILLVEKFEDCNNINFFAYNEASNKNWECNDGMYGENNSGSYAINGYQQDVLSKDWLITKNPIDFDANTGEKISFYTDAAYGTTPLVLVYSSNYDGSGNPSDFTWVSVPNITIPQHSNGGSSEEAYIFEDVDISTITGFVYVAFKYYSDNEPTRWTVDSFEITADNDDNPDTDGDGVLNANDICPNTPVGETVNINGCSNGQLDDDNDGIQNSLDLCVETPVGETVNTNGCSDSQLDDDIDGIMNDIDECSNTPSGETVNDVGCWQGELDDDNDGIMNNIDQCASTIEGTLVNALGCFTLPFDNFNIQVIGETCHGKNNGQISITANEFQSYVVTINGVKDTFNNSLTVDNLAPNTFEFCIEVEGETYEQCYSVVVASGTEVRGKVSLTSNKASIEIEDGTAPFSVYVNREELFKTSSSVFTMDVRHGDLVEVKTAVSCEGVYSKAIVLLESIVAYPNPTLIDGFFEIALPVSQQEVKIELYSIQSELISSKTYLIENSKVQLTLENEPKGLYIAKIYLDNPIIIKVVKN